MKNYKNKSIIAAIIIFVTSSCRPDLLDTIPNDRISSEIFWETEQDATYAANAMYVYLNSDGSFFAWDAMSDIAHVTLTWRAESYIEKGVYDSTSEFASLIWSNSYQAIQTANIFFDNIDKIQTDNQALINRLKSEVRTIRAYYYMRLAFLWGDIPLLTTPTSVDIAKEVARTPVNEVWDFIGEELDVAAQNLPNSQEDIGRVTKGAALSIKARAMLYSGRYEEAAKAAKAVMDMGIYDIYPSYEKLFSYVAEDNIEVIFDRQYLQNSAPTNTFNLLTPNSIFQQRNQFVPTKNIVDAYEMTNGMAIDNPASGFDPYDPYSNRDPRLGYSVYVLGDLLPNNTIYDSRPDSGTGDAIGSSENATPTGFNIQKYLNAEDIEDPGNGGINLIFFRYAEILLTYAEAKIELNQIDQSVLDAINKVRMRPDVSMPEISTTAQDELRLIVRNERTVEFAFEGLRFFDIRRWKIAENTCVGTVKGMTYVNDDGKLTTIEMTGFIKQFNAARDYLFPIPFNEGLLNKSLGQNPNW